MNMIQYSLLLPFVFGCAYAEQSEFYSGNVPAEVYRLMDSKKCAPIKDFYNRDVEAPPFVFTSNFLDKKNSIIFACETSGDEIIGKYKIVVMKKEYQKKIGYVYTDFDKCPSEIYFNNMPGGLSVVNKQLLPSSEYNLWDDTKRRIWPDKKTVGKNDTLVSVIDERQAGGAGYGLFCMDGKWYNFSYD